MATLTIGTRGSKLALTQARWVAERLRGHVHRVRIRVIRTTGDRIGAVPLAALGSQQGVKGVFTKEIEEALLAGGIDCAVHSLKDLPTDLDVRLSLGCVPGRADPRDALVGRRLADLRPGDRVGTGSLRRAAQLRLLRPDVVVAEIRGNVDTRLGKLRAGAYDAILLAAAGLERLGLRSEIAECLDTDTMIPAIGQGALGIEIRTGDEQSLECLRPLHDAKVEAEVGAERSLLRALGGGCEIPIGAHATMLDGHLRMVAGAASAAGGMVRVSGHAQAPDAASLAASLADELLEAGADLGSTAP